MISEPKPNQNRLQEVVAKFIPRFYYEGPFTTSTQEEQSGGDDGGGKEKEVEVSGNVVGRASSSSPLSPPSPQSFLRIAPTLSVGAARLPRGKVAAQLAVTGGAAGRLQRGVNGEV